MKAKHYFNRAIEYAKRVISGEQIAGDDIINACKRFQEDLKRDDLEIRTTEADAACSIMEGLFVHRKGEAIDGTPLLGKPFILEDWEIFIIYNLLAIYYKGTNERRFKEAFIMLARKNGKALSLDTEIPTPEGFKKMADIHPGDIVFGQDGKPSKVLVESEIFHKPMYAVTFEDNTVVKASADHIWTVGTKEGRRRGNPWIDTTTEKMAADFVRLRLDGKGKEYKYRVPMTAPVEYAPKNLPVDPYTLGVWLGNGTATAAVITSSKEDIEEQMELIRKHGHECRRHDHIDRAPDFSVDPIEKKYTKTTGNPFLNGLRDIGVLENKHIPEIYLRGSVDQRMELLKGLMDTDGFCSKAGECEFSQKSEIFAEEFMELLASLGIKAKKKKKKVILYGKEFEAFIVCFFTDKRRPCFKLKRKYDRLKDELAPRMMAKSIISVERIETEPSKCIAIDNDSHLYLCGRSYTATHNTSFIAALSFAVSIIQRKSGSTVYVVAAALKQALESFKFIDFSLKYKKIDKDFEIHDNSFEHSIKYEFKKNGRPDGTIEIQIMASNPDAQDSFNCNFAILDEVAAFKKAAQYNRFKEAQAAYTNRLCIGITTAGDNINSFGHGRMEYAVKVASGVVKDDSFFSFVARADQDEKGNVDYTSAIQHQKANPNYGVTIRPQDIMQDALQAQNDPQQRKDFLSRRLNIYTAAMKAWFNIEEFRASDKKYNWTLEELSKLPVKWYGGADLSRMYDLTAAALFGTYKNVDIIITHGFCPVTMAVQKSEEDNIPLFGWKEDGWLTMCNTPTVNISDIVNWFIQMRKMGFKIRQVGHDRKFAGEEYFPAMKKAGFNIIDQPQYYYLKSQGFRHIEKAAKDGNLYYLHSDAYEYCVTNVAAVEKTDDAVQYEKVEDTMRIDLFDASVFACVRAAEDAAKSNAGQSWWGESK